MSNHLQCDHLKGVRNGTDLESRVVSLSSNVELLTAIANDLGYHDSFAYQLRAQSRPGDVLDRHLVVRKSSPNILHALQWACDNGLRTIALTGFGGGDARSIAEICRPCRLRKLRNRGGPPPVHHARHGPVHPADPYARGHHRVKHVLMATRSTTTRGAKTGSVLTSDTPRRPRSCARRHQPADRGSESPVRRSLVLDANGAGDGESAGTRRGAPPDAQPRRTATPCRLRGSRSLRSRFPGPTSIGFYERRASTSSLPSVSRSARSTC